MVNINLGRSIALAGLLIMGCFVWLWMGGLSPAQAQTQEQAQSSEHPERHVVQRTTKAGHDYHYMYVGEEGVTDVTIYMAFPTAWALRSDVNPLVPHVARAAMVSGRTQGMTQQEIQRVFEETYTYADIYVRPDHVIAELSFPINYQLDILEASKELFTQPMFEQRWIGRIKRQLIGDIRAAVNDDQVKLGSVTRELLLGDYAMNRYLAVNDPALIEAIDVEMLSQWHAETFLANTPTIVVTGRIEESRADQTLDYLLKDLPTGQVHRPQPAQLDLAPRTVLLHDPDADAAWISFVGALPDTRDGLDALDALAFYYFAGHNQSPLFEAVRTQLRASYGFQVSVFNYGRYDRQLIIWGEIAPEKMADGRAAVLEAYEQFRLSPSLEDFEDVLAGYSRNTAANVDSIDRAAYTIMELALDGLAVETGPAYGDLVASFTQQQLVERLRADYPRSDQLLVVALSPDADVLPGACVITAPAQVKDCD